MKINIKKIVASALLSSVLFTTACSASPEDIPVLMSFHNTDVQHVIEMIDAIAEADMLVFATPVYWWGVTAQLKLIIDKMYSKCEVLKATNKKVGIIAIGEAEQEDPQYELIAKQFECICEYLGWKIIFSKSYTAGAAGELAENKEAVAELEVLWKNI